MANNIIISTIIADSSGHCLFKFIDGTELESTERRVQRVATLDGGVVINDLGFTHGDRTFKVVARLSKAQLTKIKNIIETHSAIMVFVDEGVFLGHIERNKVLGDVINLTILIKEKLT